MDSSRVIPYLSENNYQFRVSDLLNLKEVGKITQSKDELVDLIESINYLKLSENQEAASYEIEQNLVVFSLLNVPQKMSKEELLSMLNLDSSQVLRLYKRSLYWILVTTEDYQVVEKRLKEIQFEDKDTRNNNNSNTLQGSQTGIKLKFDSVNRNNLIKNINKQIQNCSYQKEAQDLKAEKKANGNNSNIAGNYNSNSSNKDRTNSEAFSWRKKSTDQSGIVIGLNSPKMSME